MKKNLILALVMCLLVLFAFSVTASAEDTYTLTVNGGTGSGQYAEDERVSVSPNAPPAGKVFVRWDTSYNYLYGVNLYEENLSFKMPDAYFTLTAVFADLHTHAPCGDAACTNAIHPAHTAHNYLPLEDVNDLRIVKGDNYYHLSQDITITNNVSGPSYISIGSGQTLYLCLHGYDITSTAFHAPVFSVSGTGKLVICDCKGTDTSSWGKITHGSSSNGIGIDMSGNQNTADDPVLEMYGGNITGNTPNSSDSYNNVGAGIYADYGAAITMYNGAITNNKTSVEGGGVCIFNGSTFTMYDGTISGNTAYKGGGIYSDSRNETVTAVVIHGGTITGNTATYRGGGMYIARSYSNSAQDLLITGGTITRNKSSQYGGGLYLDYSQATMSGGTISDNSSTYQYEDYGGGVYLYTSSRFNMSGGIITNNTADYGAGVYVTSGCNGFFVSGSATVKENKTSNVYLDSWDNQDKCIQITGSLTGTIGITTEHTPTATKPVRFLHPSNYTISESDLNHIVSDRSGTYYVKNIDQENYGIFGYVQYNINIASMANGDITVSSSSAAEGKTITLTAKPNFGYELVSYKVTTRNGTSVTVSASGTFTMPASNVTVSATFRVDASHVHTPCGDTSCTDSNHPSHSVQRYRPWDGKGNLTLETGENYYYLTADVTRNSMIYIESGQELYLCLGGHSLKTNFGSGNFAAFYIGSGSDGKLVLCDCEDGGKITPTKTTGELGRGIEALGGSVEMYGGKITGCISGDKSTYRGDGSGVHIENGAFTMYGGEISNNKSNNSYCYGGGVYVDNGSFTMHGGTISGNKAHYGGGVCGISSTITITGGTISGNQTTSDGGGIYARSRLVMSGGSISNNTSAGNGGGIYNDVARSTINGGTISGNNAKCGGGIYNNKGLLDLNGGTVTENTANTAGGICSNLTSAYSDAVSVSGNVNVSENKDDKGASNFHLFKGDCLTLTGPLKGQISVYTVDTPDANAPVRFLQSSDSHTVTPADMECVTSDRSGSYFVKNIDREHYGIFGKLQYTVTVTSGDNGSAEADYSLAESGTAVKLTAKPNTGYQLKEWQIVSGGVTVTDNKFTMADTDVEIKAIFEPASFNYTVETYMMDVNGQYGDAETASATGIFGSEVELVPEQLEGFTLDTDASKLSGEVKADGSLVLSVYYIRNQYEFTYIVDEAETSAPYYYGESVPAPAAPAKPGHTFAGWDVSIPATMPANDVTVTAKWTINTYPIKFVNEDGTVLQSGEVAYGETPVYTGETPAKAATAQYSYTFTGWSPEISAVTGEATYTAIFSNGTNTYTVTWVDEDGTTILEKDEGVPYGTMPSFEAAEPTKAATAQYTYTFAGWSPTVSEVTGNATYKATYTTTVNKYTVKFVNEDGTVLQSGEAAYGETPVYTGVTPVKAADAQYTYTFAGWTPAVAKVTGSATYKATFSNNTNSYTVTWQNEAGELIDAESVEYGGSATKSPAVPDKLGYTGKWNHDGKNIVQNTIIKPEYTANQYTLTFNTAGGSTIAPITQAFGSVVTAPAVPTKEGWTFQGWDKKLPATMPAENLTLTATWIPATQLKAFSLSADEFWLHRNQTHQLELTGLDPQDAICEFVWTSSDPAILTVNNSGLLTASGTGTAVLTVTEKWSGLSQSCTVHIVSPVTGISFAESNLQMIPGDTWQLTATVTCPEESVTNQLVTFSSSNKSVATVDENGVVTAIAEGTVTITATAANGVSASCTINVLLLGDANNDGKLDVADVLIILQYSAGWDVTVNPAKADVTGDGTIGISDALKILQDCMGGDIVQAMRALQRMLADLNARSLEITGQPVDQRVTAGETAAFTVTAAGDALQYQWYIDRNDGNGWQKLNNAAEATYITSKTETDNDGYQYRCVVTDAHGAEATTASAVLHVVLDLPNTGDASMPALWLAMCLLSGVGLMVLSRKKTLR